MKIRFLQSYPQVNDKDGAFSVWAIDYGPGGSSLSDMAASGFLFSSPQPNVFVTAVYTDLLRGLVGMRLSAEDYSSVAQAANAMQEGFELVTDLKARSFVRRLISAGAALELSPPRT